MEAEMTQESQPHNDIAPSYTSAEWSIGSGKLTAKGEAELMRLFGAGLAEGYAQTLVEPVPGSLQSLLAKLDAATVIRE
jgi:hypothetical protein